MDTNINIENEKKMIYKNFRETLNRENEINTEIDTVALKYRSELESLKISKAICAKQLEKYYDNNLKPQEQLNINIIAAGGKPETVKVEETNEYGNFRFIRTTKRTIDHDSIYTNQIKDNKITSAELLKYKKDNVKEKVSITVKEV